MSWASGSEMMSNIITTSEKFMQCGDNDSVAYYKELIECFEDFDCDTLHECLGENVAFDVAFAQMYPEHYEELMEN